jgi:UDP-GlcNAc3NAcA epimerase
MTKIVTIVGARPQFIKAATVSRAMQRHERIAEILVHTGQHFDSNMSDVFFEELEIPRPRFHLGVHGGMHGEMTGKMLAEIEGVLVEQKPDWLLVYGDTNSTLAGALAAAKLHIGVAHVEAGLRSFNRGMPEEINRVLTDHVAQLLFAPTDVAVRNLAREGVSGESVRRVGDVMFDAAQFYASRAPDSCEAMRSAQVGPKEYVLATVHRAENTDDQARLRSVIACLDAATQWLPVILPLHPRTRQALARMSPPPPMSSRLHIIDPVGYLDMVALETNARLIATDSGGVQKEAYFHRVPCITLREETEWVELVDAGWNVLVGADVERFVRAFERLSREPLPPWSAELYGDGNAAALIADQLASAA